MVDTTIYGYIFDGYVLHPDCVTEDRDVTAKYDDTAGRLYSHDDTGEEGLSCDACGDYIFEPDVEYVALEAIRDALYWPSGQTVDQMADAVLKALQDRRLLAIG